MSISLEHSGHSEMRFKRLDALLLGDLQQLEEDQQAKLAEKVICNGYVGDNADVIITTLQRQYIEYDMGVFHQLPARSSAAVAVVERWTLRHRLVSV